MTFKKFYAIVLLTTIFTSSAIAQTEKDNILIGANFSNFDLSFQKGNSAFSMNITPKVAWFLRDNIAVGAQANLGLETSNGYTSLSYSIGPLARLYFAGKEIKMNNKTKIFLEGNAGIAGSNVKISGASVSTNGFGFGFGPGIAYFLNNNIGLEALLKYDLNVGFGNATTTNNLNFNVGLQIYLPKKKLKSIAKKVIM